jgi:predicted ABC-type ATPase
MKKIDQFVVYRGVRTAPGVSSTYGTAWNVTRKGDALTWHGNDDQWPTWEESGEITVKDPRHFRLVREDGVSYEFYPLTYAGMLKHDPVLLANGSNGIDTDADVQNFWIRLFGQEVPALTDLAASMGSSTLRGFSDEDPETLSEEMLSEMLAEGIDEAGFPIGAVRTWCSHKDRTDCNFYQKVEPTKWIRLPKARASAGSDDEGSSAWKDSDPSLPTSSAALHKVKNADGSMSYTAERKELHKEILDRIFRGKQKSLKPTAVFVIGPPASGKSATRRMRSEMTGDQVASIDPDDIRVQLPEFDEAVAKKVRNAGSITYEETQNLNNDAVAHAIGGGFDFVMDAAGGLSDNSIDWFKKTFGELKSKGYNVKVVMHHTPDLDKLLLRSEDRGIRSGRFVPPSLTELAVSLVPRHIKEYENLVDDFTVFDTSEVDGDPPQDAREVYSRSGDRRKISDPSFSREHLGVTEGTMSETKRPPLDMSNDAIKARFILDLNLDAARTREESPITSPGEGVTWDVFDPAEDPPDLKR